MLTSKPLMWAAGVLLVLVAALCGALAIQSSSNRADIAELTSDRNSWKQLADSRAARVEELAGYTRGSAANVHRLAGLLKAQVRTTERLDTLQQAAVASRDEAIRARDAIAQQAAIQRDQTYASDSTCGTWGARPVCGAISGSLFDQWNAVRSADRGGAGSGGGSGGTADRGGRRAADGLAAAATAVAGDPGHGPRLRPAFRVLLEPPAGIHALDGAGLGQ